MKLMREWFKFFLSAEFVFVFSTIMNQVFIHYPGFVIVMATMMNGIVRH